MEDTLIKWVPVTGYEGRYFINIEGAVLSINNLKGNLILTPQIRGGYLCYGLYKDFKQTKKPLHQLVANHFIPNPENKKCVNHIDGNKLNNNIKNLEWVTYSENAAHAIKTGLRVAKSGRYSVLFGLTKLDHYRAVRLQCLCTGAVMNIKDASKFLNIDRSCVSRMVHGKTYNWTNFIKI